MCVIHVIVVNELPHGLNAGRKVGHRSRLSRYSDGLNNRGREQFFVDFAAEERKHSNGRLEPSSQVYEEARTSTVVKGVVVFPDLEKKPMATEETLGGIGQTEERTSC